ncbi:MAG: hypothetical protein ACR2RE_07650 [Geminicoccaceae bacterium]
MSGDKIVSLIPREDAGDKLFVLKNHPKFCDHRWEIDQESRTINCHRCGVESTAWDVLIRIAYQERDDHKVLESVKREIVELRKWNPFLKAVRRLEKIWRGKMLPTCPNCGIGITAQALTSTSQVNRDYPEIAKRRVYEVSDND